jgi:hypothetical protein
MLEPIETRQEINMWMLHYKSNLGSFMEESYKTLGELFEALDLLHSEFKVVSFRVRYRDGLSA